MWLVLGSGGRGSPNGSLIGPTLETVKAPPVRAGPGRSGWPRPRLHLLDQLLAGALETVTTPEVSHQVLAALLGLEPLNLVAL